MTERSARTLVAIIAHADDESAIGPILARYAREGVRVILIVATDGGQGAGSSRYLIRDTEARGDELIELRAAEARSAAAALGIEPPILLGFPDGKLGDYVSDRSLLSRVADAIAGHLRDLRPDALITWGPDGGTGHADHRVVSAIVMQLICAGAPGATERVYYMSLPAGIFHVFRKGEGPPPLLIPLPKYFTVRVPFGPEDVAAARRAMACHRSQFSEDLLPRLYQAQESAWNGAIPLICPFGGASADDVFG